MGMQKLGYNMLRRLHARPYSRAQVSARNPARGPACVPDTFLPLEKTAAEVVLCTSLFYGFLYVMDFAGVRTVYEFLHEPKTEVEKSKSEELRAEAERRDDKDDNLLQYI